MKVLSGKTLTIISMSTAGVLNGLGQVKTTGATPLAGKVSRKVFDAAKMLPWASEIRATRSTLATELRERFSAIASRRGEDSCLDNNISFTLTSGYSISVFCQTRLEASHSKVALTGVIPASRLNGPSKIAKISPLGT